jgi:hypothetical protein
MRHILVVLALLFSHSAFAQQVDFKVLRGDCAGGPSDLKQLNEIQSVWLADGTLEITAWDSETQEHSVVDGSASLDTTAPGVIRLIYLTKFIPIPPDAPVLMCEDFVRLKFFVRGVKRSDYFITIEKSQLLVQSRVKG